MRTTIRSAYQQGTGTAAPAHSKKCPHCGGVNPSDLATDAMIERAKQMAPKPFKRDRVEPDAPQGAAADDTAVRRRIPAGRRSVAKPDPMLQQDLDTANRNLKKRY